MNTVRSGVSSPTGGFTLLEMLVAVTVAMIFMGFLVFMVDGVQKAWIQGDQKVETYQGGRAALELFAREVSIAVVSGQMQFVQSPALSGKVSNLAENSPSLFWMAPGQSTSKGNLCEIGYFITRNASSGTYQLHRFYLRPDNANGLYLGADNYDLQSTASKRPWSFANEALWITKLNAKAFDLADPMNAVSVLADGVVAMWIRCLDKAGNPIPWLSAIPGYSSGTIQFSSGASFQMTTADAPFDDAGDDYSNAQKTFQYTAGPTVSATQTAAANRLPAYVEITLVMVDSRTLQRKPAVPAMPLPTNAADIPSQIQEFQESLVNAGIRSARTFTKRVKTLNEDN